MMENGLKWFFKLKPAKTLNYTHMFALFMGCAVTYYIMGLSVQLGSHGRRSVSFQVEQIFVQSPADSFVTATKSYNVKYVYSTKTTLEGKLDHFSEVLSREYNETVISTRFLSQSVGRVNILGVGQSYFSTMSFYQHITTYALSWYPLEENNLDLSTQNNTINSVLPIKTFYTCVVDKRFGEALQYTNYNNTKFTQNCGDDLTLLTQGSPVYNPTYSNYHNISPVFNYDIYKLTKNLIPMNITWNTLSEDMDQYPDFITYVSIVRGSTSMVSYRGEVYYKNSIIIPFTCTIIPEVVKRDLRTYERTIKHKQPYSRVFVIAQPLWTNYYHIFAESLIKLVLYRDYLAKHPDIRIHITASRNKNIQYEIARMLGIKNSFVSGTISASETIIPMGMGCMNPSAPALQLAAKILQQNFVASLGSEPEWDTVLVLVRSDRNFMDYSQLIKEVQNVIYSTRSILRIDIFDGSKLPTLLEAITMFYRARIVIGSHGAGLTNIIFSRPGTTVIEAMCPAPYGRPCYRNMAYKLGLRYYGQLATAGRGEKCKGGMTIDFEQIKAALAYVMTNIVQFK